MDEFKHGGYAEVGWRRVNEYLRREDHNLCANLEERFLLPAEGKTGKCRDESNCLHVKPLYSRTRVRGSSSCEETRSAQSAGVQL